MIRKPKELDALASDFWEQHSRRLRAEGLLNDATKDAFGLLARTYSHLMRLDPDAEPQGWIRYFALLKSYQTFARGFGMNTDKRKEPQAQGVADEFGI